MKFILAIFLTFSVGQTMYSQVFETSQIIEKAESELLVAVGEHLFPFFMLDQESKYAYKTKSEKVKYELLTKKNQTKGDFVAVGVKFTLHHPDFNYNYVRKYINIELDSALNLRIVPYTEFLPDFLKKNNPCNWLSEKHINEILEGLNLKESKYPLFKRLNFDVQTKKYKWIIQNILFKGKNHGKIEYIEIDPISGKILIHEEMEYINTM